MSTAGPEATALAASAGLYLDGWQSDVLDVALGEREDGRWSAREFALIVPRQNGKGSILEALIIASLLLFEERLILYSAHEFKTAQETFLRVKHLVESSDDLTSRVTKIHNAHGAEGIEFRGGQRLRFVARSKGSGRGFSPQRIILDEALNLSKRAISALLPSMSAQPNPQLWYTSSHPEESEEGDVLRRVMRRGRAGDGSLAYVEYAAADDADHSDERAWAAANPGYPHRISTEAIEHERVASHPEDFARERLGIIDLRDEQERDGWAVIGEPEWAACCRPAASYHDESKLAWAIDCAPDQRSAAIANSDGSYVELVDHRGGTSWAPERLAELHRRYGFTVRLDKGGPAGSLISALEELGVPWQPVTLQEHAQACGQMLDAAAEKRLVHRGQPALDAAVKHAERRHVSDVWLWTRSKSSGDISPLVAAGLARWAAQRPAEADFFTL